MIGLAEIVQHHGERIDLFDLAAKLRLEFGRAIVVTKAAELLDVVDTPGQEVALTALGRDFVNGDVNQRKRLLHQQLRTLGVFAYVLRLLERAPEHRLPAEVLKEQLVLVLPNEDPDALFDTIVGWGRYGELIGYEATEQVVYLDEGVGA
jgi:NitT/TauT family transport system ATP-binding protein